MRIAPTILASAISCMLAPAASAQQQLPPQQPQGAWAQLPFGSHMSIWQEQPVVVVPVSALSEPPGEAPCLLTPRIALSAHFLKYQLQIDQPLFGRHAATGSFRL